MSTKIQRLSEEAINQIAAGEVIENPSSVVKELVENSLDAGAKRVEIVLLSGGQERIRVVDDGCGMSPEDALLSLEPHATSKIRSAGDLARVVTMGFRGEALPSIASISRCTIETSEGGEGVRLISEGGTLLKTEPIARTQGTTVTVDELFYNTPVRKGFQRAAAADLSGVRKMVTLLALAHPEVGFTLRQGEEILIHTTPFEGRPFLETFEERAREVLGNEFQRGVIPFEYKAGAIRIRGLLGDLANSRPTRTGQMLVINRRPVVSPLISHAIRTALATRLDAGRHPLFALHLDLDTALLDVNVHPQKREVRFKEESELQGAMIAAISKALEEEKGELPPVAPSFVAEALISFEPLALAEKITLPELHLPKLVEAPPTIFGLIGDYLLIEPTGPFAEQRGLLILDTKRIRARTLFERLVDGLKGNGAASQTLALPVTIELLPHEVEQAVQCQAALHQLGMGVRPFGGNTVLVESLPALLADRDPKEVLERLLPTLKLEGEWEELAAQEAVKAAPQLQLTLDQAGPFVREWLRCREPMRCPRGRATCSLMSMEEMKKRLEHAR